MRVVAVASLVAVTSAVTVDLEKRRGPGRFRVPGTSIITEDGTTRINPGAAGRTSYTYVAGECYDQANNPVKFFSDDREGWIQNNQTVTDWSGGNPAQNNLNAQHRNTNWYFDIYDAYFNGTVTIKLDPPPEARCEYEETQLIPFSYFRLGMMSRPNGEYSRKDYDNNPFYFRLGRFTEGDNYDCQITSRKMFASLESSNNGYDHPQVWSTNATRNGDRYDVSGSITTTYANDNNYFNVLPFASSNTTTEASCPSHFYAATLLQNDNVTMNGSITATSAQISWYFTDAETGWAVAGTFNGTAWDGGAKLDFSSNSATPVTTGEARRVECANCNGFDDDGDDDGDFFEENRTGVIVGGVLGGLALLAVVGVGAWFFLGFWRKRHYNAARQVDHDDAWAMDDHQDERDMKGVAATSLKPIPSQQNLLHAQGMDTSYKPHRSPSPDPTGLPPYSDTYTPLK